ncbi:exo-1,3-beta-glucanase [Gonapodya sp. JEL0774]|nr:exo-1,3-beta-glucanase [Gonapodya sp. JEL0774]
MGTSACSARIQNHYATFITADDFRQIAAAGLNYVRLPINYWAVNPGSGEPYPANIGWPYVQNAIQWAANNGLTIELDLHAAPGAQVKQSPHVNAYKDRCTATLVEMVKRSAGYPNVKALQLVNEPALASWSGISDSQVTLVRSWYRDVERTIRNLTADKTAFPNGGPTFVIHDGFLGDQVYAGSSLQYQALGSTLLDLHYYSCFTQSDLQLSYDGHVSQACSAWGSSLSGTNANIAPTMVGEFSAAYSDCAPYLNGVNEFARYDGSYLAESIPNICGCSCTDPQIYDYRNWNSAKKAFIRKFVEAQMSSFEKNGIGWIFWTWKTETKLGEWDYQLGLAQGWIPNPASARSYNCA